MGLPSSTDVIDFEKLRTIIERGEISHEGTVCYNNLSEIIQFLKENLDFPDKIGFDWCVDKSEALLAILVRAGMKTVAVERAGIIITPFNDGTLEEIDRARQEFPPTLLDHITVPDTRFWNEVCGGYIINDILGEKVSFKNYEIKTDGYKFVFPYAAPVCIDVYSDQTGEQIVRIPFSAVPAVGHAGIKILSIEDKLTPDWEIIDSAHPTWVVGNGAGWSRFLGVQSRIILRCPMGAERPVPDERWMNDIERDNWEEHREEYKDRGIDYATGIHIGNNDPDNSDCHPKLWTRKTLVNRDRQAGLCTRAFQNQGPDWHLLQPSQWQEEFDKHWNSLHLLRILQRELTSSSGKLNIENIFNQLLKSCSKRQVFHQVLSFE